MTIIPPTTLISSADFHNAWARAVRYVLRDGRKITIGDASEPKPIRDACVLFELTGNAIRQIEDRELHPLFPFQHIDQYCEEFTRNYLSEYVEKLDQEQFSYLYFERLAMYKTHGRLTTYGGIDQMAAMRRMLADQVDTDIASNRNQASTWIPERDMGHTAAPCLQRIWVKYLGNYMVDVHLTWRSRDLYGAWQANTVALVDMLNREVIHPNNCKIVKLVDYSDSLHIYHSDEPAARNVKLVPIDPQRTSPQSWNII